MKIVSNKWFRWVAVCLLILVIGFVLGMEFKAYQIRVAIGDAFINGISGNDETTVLDRKSTFSEKIKENKEKIIEASLGDVIKLATIDVKVLSSEEKSMISQSFGTPEVAKEGAKFVVVAVEVTNTTPSTFEYSGSDELVDGKDRVFDSNCCIGENNLTYKTLAPGIVERGSIIFEVPKDEESYSLVFRKAGSNDVYKIKLK